MNSIGIGEVNYLNNVFNIEGKDLKAETKGPTLWVTSESTDVKVAVQKGCSVDARYGIHGNVGLYDTADDMDGMCEKVIDRFEPQGLKI